MNKAFSVGLDGVYCIALIGFKITDCIQLLGYALQYSTGKGTVNVVSSVKMASALHWQGRCRKEKVFQIGHGRIAFYEHGGKSGRAMVKYPHIQKNAQRKNTLVYPGLTTVSFDRIITYMQYYYVMCQRGSVVHRCYVLLDSESADVLHDSLEQRYDLVQVCDVPHGSVEPELVIAPAP